MFKLLCTHNIFNFELNEIIYLFFCSFSLSLYFNVADDVNTLDDATKGTTFLLLENLFVPRWLIWNKFLWKLLLF